jgi:MSHA biogenesis protein MshI
VVGLFSTASKESQIGVDFLRDGIAIAQVKASGEKPRDLLRAEFIEAIGQEAQVEALRQWVRSHGLQKAPCVCLIASDDCDVYQVEKVAVEDAEMLQAMTWKIKDLISYDVANAVVDTYPMPASSITNQQQVGVVAAHETVIASYVDSIKTSTMRLQALDIHDLVPANLPAVRASAGQSLVLMSFSNDTGMLNVYHDTDLYVSREFKIGISRLELEIQRSLDYFESFYGMAAVTDLRIFPRVEATERLALYLQNLTNYDIDFLNLGEHDAVVDPSCFHAYCAALRDLNS